MIRVLNIGSGIPGEEHVFLSHSEFLRHGFELVNIDVNPDAFEVDVILDAHDLDKFFHEDEFDVVIVSHTLEHLECPYRVLKNVYRVVKYFVILKIPHCRYRVLGECGDHIYSWSEYTIVNLLRRVVFRRVKIFGSRRFSGKTSIISKLKHLITERLVGSPDELTVIAFKGG